MFYSHPRHLSGSQKTLRPQIDNYQAGEFVFCLKKKKIERWLLERSIPVPEL
jgi:hypothetical protein